MRRARTGGAGRHIRPTVTPTRAALVLAVVTSGVFGLLIGSFLNVVIYRLPRHISVVRPRSHCPHCEHELTAADNVPVASWLVLRGRCRHCGAQISPRYPAVELSTAAIFVSLAWALGPVWALVPILVLAAAAVVGTAIDLDGEILPVPVVAVVVLAAAGLGVVGAATAEWHRLGWAALGAVAAALLSAAALHVLAGWQRPPIAALRTDVANRGRWVTIAGIAFCAGWLWPPSIAVMSVGVVVGFGASAFTRLGRAPGVLLATVAGVGFAAVIAGALGGGP